MDDSMLKADDKMFLSMLLDNPFGVTRDTTPGPKNQTATYAGSPALEMANPNYESRSVTRRLKQRLDWEMVQQESVATWLR